MYFTRVKNRRIDLQKKIFLFFTPSEDKEKEKRIGKKSFLKIFKGSCINFFRSFPLLVSILLLINFFSHYFSLSAVSSYISSNNLINAFIGDVLGSILAGNPVNSYIIGGEIIKNKGSITGATAFMIAWVTVGIVQMPVEIAFLGKRFTILRNLFSFLFAIFISLIIAFLLSI